MTAIGIAPPGLQVTALRKQMPGFTLEASFVIAVGARAGLVGPSGSGKTTLLRLLAGLESGDQGRIVLDGQDITARPTAKREIAYVFQEQVLFPALSILDNVVFGLKVRGVGREQREHEGLGWLDKVGLRARARSAVTELSGGERQRVAFVRALAAKPRLLLLDEPFSALDRSARDGLRRELLALHAITPIPLLLVSHDDEDLAAIATTRLTLRADADQTRRIVG